MGNDNNKIDYSEHYSEFDVLGAGKIKEIQKALNLQQDGIIGKQTLYHFKRFKIQKRKLSIIKMYGE
jgi:lysozyme family protein